MNKEVAKKKRATAKQNKIGSDSPKDMFYAKLAFYLSLGFWLPLFNIGLCIMSLYYAIRAIKLENSDEELYGGRAYAVTAAIISISGLILTAIGVTIYAVKKFQTA